MLDIIKVKDLDTLIAETVPDGIRLKSAMNIPDPMTEAEYLAHVKDIASQNTVAKSYIGQGYYGTFTPSVILRESL